MQQQQESSKIAELLASSTNSSASVTKSKIVYWIILIITAILFVGALAWALYNFISWRKDEDRYGDCKRVIGVYQDNLTKALNNATQLASQLQECHSNLEKTTTERDKYKKDYEDYKAKYENESKYLNDTLKKLEECQSNYAKCQKRTLELEGEITKLKGEMESLKKRETELNHTNHQLTQENLIWKVGSGGVLAAAVLVGVHDIIGHIDLWQKEELIKTYIAKLEGFDPLSEGYESYHSLSQKLNKFVISRTVCTYKSTDANPCMDKQNTLTRITTSKGFSFGIVLFGAFPKASQSLKDRTAFVFSDNHAKLGICKAKGEDIEAFSFEAGGNLMTIGRSDVIISSDGKKATFKSDPLAFDYKETHSMYFVNDTVTASVDIQSIVTYVLSFTNTADIVSDWEGYDDF